MNYPVPYRKMDKWGFSDTEKILLIDCIYDDVIYPFSKENFDLALVKIAGKCCWINTNGTQVSPLADNVFPFTKNEISVVIIDEKNAKEKQSTENCLFINRFGESVFKLAAIMADGFRNDMCIVYFPNHKYGAVNPKGEIIAAPKFDNFEAVFDAIGRPYFSDRNETPEENQELIKFEQNRYFGFKDGNDNVVFKARYFSASTFHEGTAMVAINSKAFYHIDSSGKRLYTKEYYFGFNYKYGIAKVVTDMPDVDPFVHERWGVDYYIPGNARWGYIDKKGQEFWEDQ
ncbi:MAG: WG repeat-containing protein [Crocinitomicaceae bacterium]|nr:WG repeat-containing protein [Crocinitomicaceae bacterium]